jgi:hypothetical protein
MRKTRKQQPKSGVKKAALADFIISVPFRFAALHSNDMPLYWAAFFTGRRNSEKEKGEVKVSVAVVSVGVPLAAKFLTHSPRLRRGKKSSIF